jgi:hypothetical protein
MPRACRTGAPWRRYRSGTGESPARLKAGESPAPLPRADAFTRVEFAALLAVLALVAAVILPALAGPRQRSERVSCANNLRQIGTAFQLWGNDHDDQAPQEVPVAEGGTRLHPLAANVWLHLSWLSNELNSAASPFCPTDSGRPARDFTGDPAGGYLHPNFANRATSYFLTHRFFSFPDLPSVMLAGDRNVGWDTSGGCSRFNSALSVSTPPRSGAFAWSTNLHRSSGNVLRLDGRVEQFSNLELRAAFGQVTVDNESFHFIIPR